MSTLYVYDRPDDDRYVLIRGYAREWLKRRRIPGMWSNIDRGWFVRRERLDDLLELAEIDHLDVSLRGGRW